MILQVQKGCFGYPGQPAILENIDLTLEEGHILAILGPNGIGKTTLLKCMIGLLPWHSGKTLLYGKEIHTLKPKEVWSTISYIPQSHGFAFSYTGLEMVLPVPLSTTPSSLFWTSRRPVWTSTTRSLS